MDRPEFKSRSTTGKLWASYLIFLRPGFLVCKMRKTLKHEPRTWPVVRLHQRQVFLRVDVTLNIGPQHHRLAQHLQAVGGTCLQSPLFSTAPYLHTFPGLGKLFLRPSR